MSRRPVNSNRRLVDGGGLPLAMSLQSKSISSPLLTIGLVVLVIYLFIIVLLIQLCECVGRASCIPPNLKTLRCLFTFLLIDSSHLIYFRVPFLLLATHMAAQVSTRINKNWI
jgi:hypothetical protein